MRKILNIKCITNNQTKNSPYRIVILKRGRILFNGYTNKCGYIRIRACKCRWYTIVIFARNNIYPAKRCFNVFSNGCNNQTLFVYFKDTSNDTRPVSITLTDKFYEGLPITKGELSLWETN